MKRYPIFLLLLCLNCDPVDDKLIITNQSDHKVYYMWAPQDLSPLYEDILNKQGIATTYQGVVNAIDPNKSEHETLMGRRGKAWENYIKHTCENGKLRVYTFSIDTLKKYNFKDVADNNRYISRKEVSIDDLNKWNWEIKLP